MTPFLMVFMGLPAPTAIGTDMVFATTTKLAGSIQHSRQRSINIEVALFLGAGSIPASLAGVWVLEWMEGSFDPAALNSVMTTVISATLLLVGASLVFRVLMPQKWAARRAHRWDGEGRMSRRRRAFTVLFGAAGGFLVGLTSIGAGSIMAIILLLLYPLSPAVVVGTDIAHATVLSLATGLTHALHGNVDPSLVGILLLGGIPGALLGSRATPLIPGRPLKLLLAAMLVLVGALLLF